MIFQKYLHKESGFDEVTKNLVRYRSENNFVELFKLCKTLKLVARILL